MQKNYSPPNRPNQILKKSTQSSKQKQKHLAYPYSRSPPLSPTLNRNRSSLSRSPSDKDLTVRYKELYGKYVLLIEQVKDRNHLFQLQEKEIQQLRKERDRDQRELYRLRSMIGFIKKDDKGIQVAMQDIPSGGSWAHYIKQQRQTAAQCQRQLDLSFYDKYAQQPLKRVHVKKSPTNRQSISHTFTQNSNPIKTANMPIHSNKYQKYKLDQSIIQNSSMARTRTQNLYSPKASIYNIAHPYQKTRQSKQSQWGSHKLSNSPYSKLKFSKNINII